MEGSKAVYEFPLGFAHGGEIDIVMPRGAELLHVAEQHGTPCIWALVRTGTSDAQTRRFRIAGTGHPIPDDRIHRHVGSFLMEGGALVFHVFEIVTIH